jgi:protein-tyrosine phosphatase
VTAEDAPPETVLVVCTANQCRSPIAAALLRRALEGRDVTVVDAGFGAAGFPATSPTIDAAALVDLDLSAHASTTLDADAVADADLILTMERAHVREIVVENGAAWPKTFTLKELARRGEEVGPRPPGEPLADWLAMVHDGRSRTDLLGASPLDDVADPTTDRRVDHAGTTQELLELVDEISALVWPPAAGPAVTR